MTYLLIFYNSLNVDPLKTKNFAKKIENYITQNHNHNILESFDKEKPILIGIYDILKDFSNFKNLSLNLKSNSKILLFTLGGDGTLFNSLSLIRKKLDFQKENVEIFVIPLNFGSKGFYCFYDKNLINNEMKLWGLIDSDYKEKKFLKGLFWKIVSKDLEEYFVGDIVIKNKITYKPFRIRYYIQESQNFIEELSDGLLIFSKFGTTGYFLSLYGTFIDLDIDDLIGISFIAPHSIKYKPQIFKNKNIYIENIYKNELLIIKDGQELKNNSYQTIERIQITLDNNYFYLMGKTNIFDRWYNTFYT